MEKRSFGTAKDDSGFIRTLRPTLADSWQDEDGVVRSHLLHTIEIDDLNNIADCEFAIAPGDYNTLIEYPVFYETGAGSTTGGMADGFGIGGGGTTTNTPTPTTSTMLIDNTTGSPVVNVLGSYQLASDTTYKIKAVVLGVRVGGSAGGAVGDSISYEVTGDFKNVAGTVTVVGGDGALTPTPNSDDTAMDANFFINGTKIDLKVTTPANEKIKWKSITLLYSVAL
jgi:hypothetical protein